MIDLVSYILYLLVGTASRHLTWVLGYIYVTHDSNQLTSARHGKRRYSPLWQSLLCILSHLIHRHPGQGWVKSSERIPYLCDQVVVIGGTISATSYARPGCDMDSVQTSRSTACLHQVGAFRIEPNNQCLLSLVRELGITSRHTRRADGASCALRLNSEFTMLYGRGDVCKYTTSVYLSFPSRSETADTLLAGLTSGLVTCANKSTALSTGYLCMQVGPISSLNAARNIAHSVHGYTAY